MVRIYVNNTLRIYENTRLCVTKEKFLFLLLSVTPDVHNVSTGFQFPSVLQSSADLLHHWPTSLTELRGKNKIPKYSRYSHIGHKLLFNRLFSEVPLILLVSLLYFVFQTWSITNFSQASI